MTSTRCCAGRIGERLSRSPSTEATIEFAAAAPRWMHCVRRVPCAFACVWSAARCADVGDSILCFCDGLARLRAAAGSFAVRVGGGEQRELRAARRADGGNRVGARLERFFPVRSLRFSPTPRAPVSAVISVVSAARRALRFRRQFGPGVSQLQLERREADQRAAHSPARSSDHSTVTRRGAVSTTPSLFPPFHWIKCAFRAPGCKSSPK